MSDLDKKERLRKRRQNYVDCASFVDRIIDQRYFPAVSEALAKRDEGQDDFKKICEKVEIPDGMVDKLWETLLEVNTAISNEPGWIPGG